MYIYLINPSYPRHAGEPPSDKPPPQLFLCHTCVYAYIYNEYVRVPVGLTLNPRPTPLAVFTPGVSTVVDVPSNPE